MTWSDSLVGEMCISNLWGVLRLNHVAAWEPLSPARTPCPLGCSSRSDRGGALPFFWLRRRPRGAGQPLLLPSPGGAAMPWPLWLAQRRLLLQISSKGAGRPARAAWPQHAAAFAAAHA